MKQRILGFAALAAVSVLASCGTTNGIRWAYGETSIYDDGAQASNRGVERAIFGIPVILTGVACDVVTLPVQALFGVWPLWGSSSMMKPKGV